MFLLKTSIRKLIPFIPKYQLNLNTSIFAFCTNNKKRIDEQLQSYSDSLSQQNIKQDYTEVVNNYIQLQQNSFTRYAKQNKNDPQLMLMFLSTFQDSQEIVEYLPMLYPYIDYYQPTQLLLLLQKVLAFKPQSKPKIPFPKPLQNIQSILVIMSQIYKADGLVQWLKLIPIYTGQQFYVLFMGYFSILQKLPLQIKSRNQTLWVKCHQKINSVLSDQTCPVQIRVGILILAFQLDYGQACPLLLITPIDYDSVDPYKNCLLFINISKYLQRRISKDTGLKDSDTEKIQKLTKKNLNQIVQSIMKIEFANFMKIQLFIQMWTVLKQQKQLKGIYAGLTNKMVKLIINKRFLKSMHDLTMNELLIIFQTLQKHKINHEKALKMLLVLFSPNLNNLTKSQFIRLLKCLVTYVRQCQDYLINARQVLQQRKNQFNQQQAIKINQILRRVQVLFPKKFALR